MRTKLLFLMLAGMCMLSPSCTKEDAEADPSNPQANVPDPEGTVSLSMRNANNGDTEMPGSYIYIDHADNFVNRNSYGEKECFVSLGRVNGLGNVSYIPKTGWTSSVAVVPGEGYVAYSSASGRFYRIFVMSYTSNVLNEVIGAEVKYQTPFVGADEAITVKDKTVILEEKTRLEAVVQFTNKGIIPCTVTAEGCNASLVGTDGKEFLPGAVSITALEDIATDDIPGKVTLTTASGKTTEIIVTTKGKAPSINLGDDISVDCSATNIPLPVESNVPLSEIDFSVDAGWCVVNYEQESFVLAIAENPTGSDRQATITATSKDGKAKSELTITQAKLDFNLTQNAANFDRNFSNISLTLTPADLNFTVKSSNESWCTFSWNQNTLTVRATANTTNKDRSATVTVTVGEVSKRISVDQNRYAAGDYYNENKVEGVVFDAGGLHGKIISMDENRELAWSTETVATGATDMYNGMNNMNVIRAIPNWKPIYPAFAWCDAKNINGITGWYLPAHFDITDTSKNIRVINTTLNNKGGTQLGYDRYAYWSSSEMDNTYAYCVGFVDGNGRHPGKNDTYRVRAVRAF